ncbi:hypothetical protein Syun_011841 [Stephania yunnanensis]|uniref:Uncharacterized protein n=1 Tax=Stephania yunnanensis TaxID=152371 RepID=A0AAP0JYI1_9MAGN
MPELAVEASLKRRRLAEDIDVTTSASPDVADVRADFFSYSRRRVGVSPGRPFAAVAALVAIRAPTPRVRLSLRFLFK